jgi:uncharacterized protein YaiI (UPF0178 family)
MQIWVDADACPTPIKDILFRATTRVRLPLTLVANKLLATRPSRYIKAVRVPAGSDVADAYIVTNMAPGDLVITADIPLAAAVIQKQGYALNPNGVWYSEENVGQCLSIRNFMDDLRSAGVITGGPAPLNPRDREAFANALDRFLAKQKG